MDSLYLVCVSCVISLRELTRGRPALPSAKRPRTSRSGGDPRSFGEGAPFDEFQDFGSGAMEFDRMQGEGRLEWSIVDRLCIVL